MSQIKECLACERLYSIEESIKDGVEQEFADTYCSKKCFDELQAELYAESSSSKAQELNAPQEQTAQAIAKRFGLRLPSDNK